MLLRLKINFTDMRLGSKIQSIYLSPNGHEAPDLEKRPSGYKTTTTESSKFIRKGPPYPPLDVNASEQIDGTSIKISWTRNGHNGSPITKIYIEARTNFDSDTSWDIIKISNKTEKLRESEIVTLSPWVQYKIRVIAENKYGQSKPSNETEKWIKTPVAKPVKHPTNIKGKGTGPNEITVTFQPLESLDQNAPGIEYLVHYKEKGSSYDPQHVYVPESKNKVKLMIRNSDAFYRPYEIQVQAKNDVGYGPLSSTIIVYTGERFPLAVPQNLHVQILSSTSAIARWDDVDQNRISIRGKFLGYKLLYWVKPLPGHPQSEQYRSTKANEIKVKLTPFTEYCFQVVAFNSVGDGPAGKLFGPLKTPEGRPSKPANFKVIEAKDGEATLSWNEPLHKNGKIVKYNLIYRVLDDGKRIIKDIQKDKQFIVLSNLISNARYSFILSASTSAGTGETEEIEFDFSKVPTTMPEKPKIASIGYNAVVLTWTPYKNVTGYKVFYWAKGDSQTRAFALWERDDDVVTTIKNLDQGTLYSFQIAAINKYGTGPKSAAVKAKTKTKVVEVNSADTANRKAHSQTIRYNSYIVLMITLIAVFVPR